MRRKSAAYQDRDPEVLIIGAGQGGLALAARFAQIGVDALVIENHELPASLIQSRAPSVSLG